LNNSSKVLITIIKDFITNDKLLTFRSTNSRTIMDIDELINSLELRLKKLSNDKEIFPIYKSTYKPFYIEMLNNTIFNIHNQISNHYGLQFKELEIFLEPFK